MRTSARAGGGARLAIPGTSPDRLYVRGADLPVPTDHRHSERDGCSGDYPVRQIWNFVAVDGLHRLDDQTVQWGDQKTGTGVVQRAEEAFPGGRRQATLLDEVDHLDETDGRHMDRVSCGGRSIQSSGRSRGKACVAREMPDDGMRVDDDRRHQMSSRGKPRQASRWFSSISFAEREMPRSAQRPSRLIRAAPRFVSARNRAAWSSSSCCFSAGNARTASRIASSMDISTHPPLCACPPGWKGRRRSLQPRVPAPRRHAKSLRRNAFLTQTKDLT